MLKDNEIFSEDWMAPEKPSRFKLFQRNKNDGKPRFYLRQKISIGVWMFVAALFYGISLAVPVEVNQVAGVVAISIVMVLLGYIRGWITLSESGNKGSRVPGAVYGIVLIAGAVVFPVPEIVLFAALVDGGLSVVLSRSSAKDAMEAISQVAVEVPNDYGATAKPKREKRQISEDERAITFVDHTSINWVGLQEAGVRSGPFS